MQITWDKLLAVFGGISIIGGGMLMIKHWISPALKYSHRLTAIEKERKQDRDSIQDIQQCNQLLCKGMLALMESQLTGNNHEKLKVVKDQMQEYLIER